MNKKGDWMQTYGGMKFWPLDPDPDRIIIEDIAHALSNICRYGGHARKFYSVAEHSIHVSNVEFVDNSILLDEADQVMGGEGLWIQTDATV